MGQAVGSPTLPKGCWRCGRPQATFCAVVGGLTQLGSVCIITAVLPKLCKLCRSLPPPPPPPMRCLQLICEP